MAEIDQQDRRGFTIYKIVKQVTLVAVWTIHGLFVEVVGPTLPDLGDFLDVNYEALGRALAMKSLGVFLGAFSGGILHERFYRHTDLFMFFGLLMAAFGMFLLPWFRQLSVVAFSLFLTGVGEGWLNTGGNVMVMHLWGVKAASSLHSLHFGFALGAMLAPQIARPFLAPRYHPDEQSLNHTTLNSSNDFILLTPDYMSSNISNDSHVSPLFVSRLHYPYTIIGIVTFLMALVMLSFYKIGFPKELRHRKGTKNMLRLFNPGSCSNDRPCYGTILVLLTSLLFLQCVGGERAYGKYLYSYAIKSDVRFNRDEAVTLNTIFWMSHMGGRAAGVIVAKYVHVNYIIAGDIMGCILSSIILSFFGYDKPLVLCIFTGFMGIFISILFPATMAWSNLNLTMNSMAVMVFGVGAACGAFLYQYVPGLLFDAVGPRSLMYIMIVYAICLGLVFIAMQSLVKIYGISLVVTHPRTNVEYDDADSNIGDNTVDTMEDSHIGSNRLKLKEVL